MFQIEILFHGPTIDYANFIEVQLVASGLFTVGAQLDQLYFVVEVSTSSRDRKYLNLEGDEHIIAMLDKCINNKIRNVYASQNYPTMPIYAKQPEEILDVVRIDETLEDAQVIL